MKRWLTMAGVIGLLVMALAVPGVQAASTTLYVGTCGTSPRYTTIQSAVDAVNGTGFTINVCTGTYAGNVQIKNKENLTIHGCLPLGAEAQML